VKRLILFVSATVLGIQAQAREATIQDFSQAASASDDAAAASSPRLPQGPAAGVVSEMRAHFEGSKVAVPDAWGGTIVSDQLLNPEINRKSGPPGIPGTFSHDYNNRASVSCDGGIYTPTWWLPREAEARRARYFGIMASIACEHGIPTNLLDAVIAQESGYRSWAVSSAGAIGMMQIMPETARVLRLTIPFDPIANMRAGARYLRQQIDRFGRIDLSLAAYNAGPERRSLRAGMVPTIPETRHYVRTITTNWARLASRRPELVTANQRGTAAMLAVRAAGYRSVELIGYEGSNASNPM